MTRRPGVTLIEVLVSIFVTAIGLLALLALFPVGAFSMAASIRSGRCVQASINAKALASSRQIWQDSSLVNNGTGLNMFTAPPASGLLTWPALPPSITYTGPSYAIYIDPIGVNLGSNSIGAFPAPGPGFWPSPGIPRSSLSFLNQSSVTGPTSSQLALRWLSILDDINFTPAGSPTYPSPVLLQVERETRYRWTYMLQRPTWNYSGSVFATVVVYSGRSPVVLGENAFGYVGFSTTNQTTGQSPNNTVDVTWDPTQGQSKPVIKNGMWILDATVVWQNPNSTPAYNLETPPEGPHANFYRVVGVTEIPGANTLTLEFQTNIQQDSIDRISKPNRNYGVLVVMDNVVEVFDRIYLGN